MPDETKAPPAGDEAAATTDPEDETGTAAPQDTPDDDRQVWDPAIKRWVDPHQIPPEAPAKAKATRRPVLPPSGDAPYLPAPTPGGAAGPAILLAAIVGAVLGIAVVLFFPGAAARRAAPAASTAPPDAAPQSDPVQLSEAVRPSVVGVRIAGSDRSVSGVVMDAQGVIVTTADILGDAESATVTYYNGRTSPARVEGIDPVSGLGVLTAERVSAPAVVRGTAEFLRTGEPLVAVAAPEESYTTVDIGLVLSPGRPVGTGRAERLDLVRLGAAESADPGGAVVGVAGTVVGMTTDVPAESGVVTFLPMEVIVAVANQILDDADGAVKHPWIGLATSLAADDPRAPSDAEGLLVTEVIEGSPAARAELRKGDLIVEIDGDPVEGSLTLLSKLLAHEVDDEMTFRIIRGERGVDATVKVTERPGEGAEQA
jgi:putative serine protease PepD